MINKFCKKPLWEVARTLSAVAGGRTPADTVIRNGRIVNVCTAEIQEGTLLKYEFLQYSIIGC